MPMRPASPCSQPGCPALAVSGGRCAAHQRAARPDNRPSPAARGYDGTWRRVRERFLRRYPDCMMCGAPATEVDHITPLRAGGTHDAENLQSLCHACHSRKTARMDGGWGRGGSKVQEF